MSKNRLEAFSDGVIAILITIMVLELHVPKGPTLAQFAPAVPHLFIYALSFVYLGIYWNNHHHMLQAARGVNGAILWANLHLLFWLSLVPFTTKYMSFNLLESFPAAAYGVNLLLAAASYTILQHTIIRFHGPNSRLALAVGQDVKGKLSLLLYCLAIGSAFVLPAVSYALYFTVAVTWLVPDRRIEQMEDFTGQT